MSDLIKDYGGADFLDLRALDVFAQYCYQRGYDDGLVHESLCDTCIHKTSVDDVKALQESAIDELASFLTNDWGLDIMLTQTSRDELKSFILHNADQVKAEL